MLAVEAEGLRLFAPDTGAARPVPFGRAQGEVLAVLERLRGPATMGVNQDCGAGPMTVAAWPDGLGLAFQKNRFAGWSIDRRARGTLTTASGIGPGSTRADLLAAYADAHIARSTLGEEFDAGGLHGVLDGAGPRSHITYMWAGTSCVAR